MKVESYSYHGYDFVFSPPIDAGELWRGKPFARLLTLAIMGPGAGPELIGEEQQTAQDALSRVDEAIAAADLPEDLGLELTANAVRAFLGGKHEVEVAQLNSMAA